MEQSTNGQESLQPQIDMSNGVQTEIPILLNQTNDPMMMAAPLMDPTMAVPIPMQPISADEVALYDRQIRLWGMKAQELMRNAHILLIGMKALGNEIAKNLVLAGIGGLTILDPDPVTEEDLGSQFLVSEGDIGKNRADAAAMELRKMNPRVNIIVDQESVMNKLPEYFAPFQIVIITGQTFEMASTINMSCRMLGIKCYYADIYGLYGFIFSDLIIHQFTIEKENPNISTKEGTSETPTRMVLSVSSTRENGKLKETVTKQEMYCPLLLANSSPLPAEITRLRRTRMKVPPLLSCLRGFFEYQKQAATSKISFSSKEGLELFTKLANEKHMELQLPHETLSATFLRSFIQNLATEIPPTAAFVGGQLAQDVINVLGQREQPLQNLLLFDGDSFLAPVYSMQPMFDPSLVVDPMAQMPMTLLEDTNGTGVAPMSNGCKKCKQRKVKCDEQRPTCGWYSAHNLPREYPARTTRPSGRERRERDVSTASRQSSASPLHILAPIPDLPLPVRNDVPLSTAAPDHRNCLLELALMQYYIARVAPTVPHLDSNKQEGLEIYMDLIPQEGLRCPSLLQAMCAYALLHMHIERTVHKRYPRNPSHFESMGLRFEHPVSANGDNGSIRIQTSIIDPPHLHRDYLDRALKELQAAITHMNAQNADGICVASILIACTALVHASQMRSSYQDYTPLLEWFKLQHSYTKYLHAAAPLLAHKSVTNLMGQTAPQIDNHFLSSANPDEPF